MLAATPFEVVAEFFPGFGSLDKFDAVGVLVEGADHGHLRHRRQAHLDRAQPQAAAPGSTARPLLECHGAGHMVILERPDEVNGELDRLLDATGAADAR